MVSKNNQSKKNPPKNTGKFVLEVAQLEIDHQGFPPRIAIVAANFYPDITQMLVEGALGKINQWQEEVAKADRMETHIITVPGVLEIPAAIHALSSATSEDGEPIYDGFIALGCVIRGETSHYDIVAEQSAAALMRLGVEQHCAIGNGILTVENYQQAVERADCQKGDKGADAAQAALCLLGIQQFSGVSPHDFHQESMQLEEAYEQFENIIQQYGHENGEEDEDDDEGEMVIYTNPKKNQPN